MEVYLYIIAAVIILGLVMPQQGHSRKWYIIVMAALHAFVCGCRYMYLTGDLQKYAWEYRNVVNYGWFSDEVFHDGRNAGFYWLMKFISEITNDNFQLFLIFLAVVIEIIVAVFIYRYSPKPWFSYLVWNCIGFYVFGFSAIKQALAMAIIMWAMMSVLEENPKKFTLLTLLAGFIHFPALIFLPAYWLSKRKINAKTILAYLVAGVVIFIFRTPIVNFVSKFYYEEEEFVLNSSILGGRFFMIIAILLCGILLRGLQNKNFEKLFHIIAVAAICQMFSGFDNIFTRMTDYYFQFVILFIPMIFCAPRGEAAYNPNGLRAVLPFNERSLRLFILVVSVFLIWFYYRYNIGVTISYAVDDYTNFRFMWDVAK